MNIREAIQETYPEIITPCGIFTDQVLMDVGFINPHSPNYQGDGIANDETEFTFESLDDAEELFSDFCEENDFPEDSVCYVEIVEVA